MSGPIPGPADHLLPLRNEFRSAWSRFATGVTVITTVEPDGAVHGMTANGVTSVSLSPPLALACVGHERNTHALIRSSKKFGISILSAGQQAVAAHFALPPERRNPASQFEFVHLNSVPVLKGALAAMDCRVVAAHEAGDHTIFIAEVERTEVTDGDPLLWFAGEFASLAGRSGTADGGQPQGRRRGS